jgi:uncharacterized protein YcbK (DUF882 family)
MLSRPTKQRRSLAAAVLAVSMSFTGLMGANAQPTVEPISVEPEVEIELEPLVVPPANEPVASQVLRAALNSVPASIAQSLDALVTVSLYDYNFERYSSLQIARDGTVTDEVAVLIKDLFKCRRSKREHSIDHGTLAMLADVGSRYPGKTIEYVSGYRNWVSESMTSPHRAGRAIDFRVRGARQAEVRDHLWRSFHNVGIGWYPKEDFIHMDHRPGEKDASWTEIKGENIYGPSWAESARDPDRMHVVRREPGV